MHLLHDFLLIFLPLFVVLDPAGTVPVFLALTPRHTQAQRREVAAKAAVVAAVTGLLFVSLGEALLAFLGLRVEDLQIAGGLLVLILAIVDLLTPGKPAVDAEPQDPDSMAVVPLAIPLILGPATMATSLLLLNTYSPAYNDTLGRPYGTVAVAVMVAIAMLLNIGLLYISMFFATQLSNLVGKKTMEATNKIVMILIAAIAVSLIRQGLVSIIRDTAGTAVGSADTDWVDTADTVAADTPAGTPADIPADTQAAAAAVGGYGRSAPAAVPLATGNTG